MSSTSTCKAAFTSIFPGLSNAAATIDVHGIAFASHRHPLCAFHDSFHHPVRHARKMSSAVNTLKGLWAKDPVVCFACVLGAVGMILPVTVPRYWGRYPDQIVKDEQNAAAEAVRLDALRRSGLHK